ncbi:MAG: hypothetical protein KGR71_16755 [Proteobacteria bacterium]|nr:hypothetical protein [Pseudomonadota bacterium]
MTRRLHRRKPTQELPNLDRINSHDSEQTSFLVPAHIASAVALKIEIKQGNSYRGQARTLRRVIEMASQGAKTNVQTNLCGRREPANDSSLYLAVTVTPSSRLLARSSRLPPPNRIGAL